MPLFYCLAKTVVTGEIVIQGSPVTYSASSSAFDSSDISFKDAAKVATINSNAAAILATREVIDRILIEYAYVLADETITSMISNNLKTTVRRIFPRFIERIANTVDGINYILKKNTTITEGQYLLIPSGKKLFVPPKLQFNNFGIIHLGDNSNVKSNTNRVRNKNLGAAGPSPCDASTSLVIPVPSGGVPYFWNGSLTLGIGQTFSCFIVYNQDGTITNQPAFVNQGRINVLAGGQVIASGVQFKNSGSGNIKLDDPTAFFYSDPTSSYVLPN